MRADGSTAFHADPPEVISSVHEQPVVRKSIGCIYASVDICLPNSHRQPLNLSVAFGNAAFERCTWQAQVMISHGQ